MPRRTYSQDDRDVALAMLEVHKGDMKKTARAVGCSVPTLKRWAEEATNALLPAQEPPTTALPGGLEDPPTLTTIGSAEETPGAAGETADGAGLTIKQTRFIDAYLGKANGNATEAARWAGYQGDANTLSSVGYENVRKAEIAAEIASRMEATTLTSAEVLFRLSMQARSSLAEFGTFVDSSFQPNFNQAVLAGKLHLIKKLTYSKDGDMILELHDSQAALIQIGRYHRLWDGRSPDLDDEIEKLLAELAASGEGEAAQQATDHEGEKERTGDAAGQ